MGHARLAVEMLTEASHDRAVEIALFLETQNRERQATERGIVDIAVQQVIDGKLDEHNAIVLGGEGWHPGVIGIVASRIVDKFHRPTVMVALNNGLGQGSCRSIPGFHLAHALEACGEHLESFGGHEMAAGLKVQAAKFEAFGEAFRAHAKATIAPELLVPEINLDAEADLQHMTEALVADLGRLGPFGHGNRQPLLACRGLKSLRHHGVGKTGDHLQLFVKQFGRQMKCIAFGQGTLGDSLKPGTKIDMARRADAQRVQRAVGVELTVKDLRR